ncbi:hypothetical protein HHI36_001568 [Cryptolaemus montrouzieri]|uniref:Uncharacterized protein n=1 Tax=Cryptolaemus montrouzieri TaxID=559131 RepID=A0ABD2P807_9CUCU
MNKKLSKAELDIAKRTSRPTVEERRDRQSNVRRVVANEEDDQMLVNQATSSRLKAEARSSIPRLKYSQQAFAAVRDVKAAMMGKIEDISSLEKAVDLVYAGAMTVWEMAGVDMKTTASRKITGEVPVWKTRLQEKSVRDIASEFALKIKDPNFKQKITTACDILKQKVKALGHLIRRYNERSRRHKNNKLFHGNQKQFSRELEEKKNTGPPPDPKTVREFWSKI